MCLCHHGHTLIQNMPNASHTFKKYKNMPAFFMRINMIMNERKCQQKQLVVYHFYFKILGTRFR